MENTTYHTTSLGNRTVRAVTRVRDGESETFAECPHNLWAAALENWRRDHTLPCPMPWGHIMFRGVRP